MVQPWSGQTDDSLDLFASDNCDGSPTPGQAWNNAEQWRAQRLNELGIDCSGGFQEACDLIKAYQDCYAAATDLAWKHVTVGGIPAQVPDTGTVVDVTKDWLKAASSRVISTAGAVLGFGLQVVGVGNLYSDLIGAANQCTP